MNFWNRIINWWTGRTEPLEYAHNPESKQRTIHYSGKVKVTQLERLSCFDENDVLVIADVSENASKKITVRQLAQIIKTL